MGHFKVSNIIPLLLILLSIITKNSNAQQGVVRQSVFSRPILPGAPVYKNSNAFTDHLNITNNEGGPFKNVYDDVEGSPFFPENYCPAILVLSKGRVYQNIKTKLNLHTHEVIVIDSSHKELVTQDGLITDIIFRDSAENNYIEHEFRCGYPPIDKNNSFTFYQVLADGQLQLLKLIRKEVVEEKNIQSGEIKKTFKTYEEYYLFSGSKLVKLKKDKDFVTAFMTDRQPEINDYLKRNKVSFKNLPDLKNIIGYYNSLFQDKPF